jgi:hypothetical protein
MRTGRRVGQGSCLSPTFTNRGSTLTKGALREFGDFKIGRQVIGNVKYVNDLTLLVREEILLQCMTDRLIGNGRSNGVEMNVKKPRS